MRIIAGKFRGLRLSAVGKGDPGAQLRPTTDRVRESLFNILANRIDFEGLYVLDLFAGTGALGLEALSRGAAKATFVENGRVGQKLLAENIRLTKAADTTLLRCDATRLPDGSPHDLIFLDPPYGKGLGEKALNAALSKGWIAPDALIVWEEITAQSHPEFQTIDTRSFGGTVMTLLSNV